MPKRKVPLPIRPVRVEGDLAYIPLSRGEMAVIDAADVPLVSEFNWHVWVAKGRHYALRKRRAGVDEPANVYLHRTLTGFQPGHVDHRDGDGLNNTRANLRVCTQSQNLANTGPARSNKLGVKGVSRHRRKFVAHITRAGKLAYLGIFDTVEAAGDAYLQAAREQYGDFARATWDA